MRRFEFVEGTSSKFWQIALDGTSFTVTYGKIGTGGTSQTKSWPSADKAKAEHDKLVKEKTGKGYVEVTDGAAPGDDDDVAEVEEEVDETPSPSGSSGSRRFEFVEGTSSKFWEIAVDGTSFTVTYGKIGTAGTAQTKSWPSADKAKAEADKLVKEKTGKGYVEVTDGAAAPAPAPKAKPAPRPAPEAVEVDEPPEAPSAGGSSEARRFEFVEGTSSKFWQIAVDGSSFTVTYGKIGTAGQSQVKSWPTAAKAQAEADKLIAEKTGKGYVEVGGTPADAPTPTPTPTARAAPAPKAAARSAPAPAGDGGWMDAGGGYGLGIRDGSIVARNDKGKVLASVPKAVKDVEAYEMLEGAVEFLALHQAECKEAVETWMLRSLPVPRSILQAVWVDPDWKRPLENLVVEAGDVVGILRAVEDKGLGVVDLDGETRWIQAESLRIPHPILLGELDDWRSLLAELGMAQGTAQLFRETFAKPAEPKGFSVDQFQGGNFDLLAQVNNEARKLGYRVSGGCAVCRVWEAGQLVEARFYIGDGDPMYETSTGDLSWVDGRQRTLSLAEVGVVAFSEGMRMASALYAKRKIEEKKEEDDV